MQLGREKLADVIAPGKQDRIVYAMDLLSPPERIEQEAISSLRKRSEIALPMARSEDIVIVAENYDKQYYSWLGSVHLGPDNIFAFNDGSGKSLSELIIRDVEQLKGWLGRFVGQKIFIPYCSGKSEEDAAKALEINFLGNSQDVTKKFYDKGTFREACFKLGIPTPVSEVVQSSWDNARLKEIMERYLGKTGSILVKATREGHGERILLVKEGDVDDVIGKIKNTGQYIVDVNYNVEKELVVHYCISRDGGIDFLGASEQAVKDQSFIGIDFPVNPEFTKYADDAVSETFRLATFMGSKDYRGVFGVTHYAIDIRTPQSAPILAPADGYVYKTKDNGYGYSYIILAHRNNILTVYGHVSDIKVKSGDVVRIGDLVGLSGGTPGTRGAGWMTTGPHLHFEVYKNGKQVDPLGFLDVSVLPEGNLPPTYAKQN